MSTTATGNGSERPTRIAFVFPGQGSQRVGMGKALAEKHEAARAVFETADAALGFSLSKLCFEGPEEELQQTANAQPAILATSVAVLRVLAERANAGGEIRWGEIVPDYVLGHSLGEYSALVCAGALDLKDALRIVRRRGELMQEAVPLGQGGMAAVMGVDAAKVEAICKEAAGAQVLTPANFNAPTQTVIAGHAEAVQRAVEVGSKMGATVKPLKVSAPFHCPLMEPAAKRLREAFDGVKIDPLKVPVIGNVEAEPYQEAARVVDLLISQVTSPVRWAASVKKAVELGVTEVFELGAGDTLVKLIRHVDKQVKGTAVESLEQIDKVAARMTDDLERYTNKWRSEGWVLQPNGVKKNADGTHLILPMGIEWRWDDPTAHGF